MVNTKQALPSAQLLGSMLRQMYEIRIFEEALYRAFMTDIMPGTMHQAIGQEAVAVGIGHALRPDDLMLSTHRGHHHAIAKGVSLGALMAEMYAKATGTSGGLGGSLHIFDVAHGFLGTTGIVGSGPPIAAGVALALKLEQTDRLVVSFFGDGAANEGAVHEAMNLAAVWDLPVLFVCENNCYAVSTPVSKATKTTRFSDRAAAYGIPGSTIDGNDVLVVHSEAARAIARIRQAGGPVMIECMTYRFKGHSRFEPATYRPKDELEAWKARDPILTFRRFLEQEGVMTAQEADAIRAGVERAVDEAIVFAKSSPDVDPAQVLSMVFA